MGTVSFPVTWMVSTKLDRMHTAARDSANPARKAYRVRKRARKAGRPRLPSVSTVQPTRSASFHSCFRSSCRTVMDRVCPSRHSRAQNEIPFWAHTFIRRSGKGPRATTRSSPRSRFTIHCTRVPSPQASWMPAMRPVMSSSSPVMARSSSPWPVIWMTKAPPLTWISSVP